MGNIVLGTNYYLQRVTGGVLGPTTGKRTLVRARELFSRNPSFRSGFISLFLLDEAADERSDVGSEPTAEVLFDVFERVKDGTYIETFRGFDINLDKLCWSQDQIITLVEDHLDRLHIANFFLFKIDDEFFVALVNKMEAGELMIRGHSLLNDNVWSTKNGYEDFSPISRSRFFFPQIS